MELAPHEGFRSWNLKLLYWLHRCLGNAEAGVSRVYLQRKEIDRSNEEECRWKNLPVNGVTTFPPIDPIFMTLALAAINNGRKA